MFRQTDDQASSSEPKPEKSLFEAMMGMTAEQWDAIVAVERGLDDDEGT